VKEKTFSRRLAVLAAFFLLTVFAGPSQAQTFDPEQAIRTYFDKVSQLDFDGWVELFTHDGVLEDPVGTPAHRGHKELRSFVGGIAAPFSQISATLNRVIVVSPTQAAVSWTIHGTLHDGRSFDLEGIGSFRFNEDGKLREVREYWDLGYFLANLAGQPYQTPPFPFQAQIDDFFAAGATLDIDRYLSLFTPDGVLHDPVGTPAYRGHKAIRDHLQQLTGPFLGLNFTVEKVIAASGTDVAVQWTVEAPTTTGKVVRLPGIILFRFNEDGLIRSNEEFWSLADLLGQL
jgi:steroid Delta-isomerase